MPASNGRGNGPSVSWVLSLYWIFDAVRHFTVPEAERVFLKAAELRPAHPSIIGIGLGGDERQRGSEPFHEMYAEAAKAGLRLTNHAGETTPRLGDMGGTFHRLGAHRPRAFGG